MSIVGTRPPLISETNLYEPHHKVNYLIIQIWDEDGCGEVNNRTVVWSELLGLSLVFRYEMIVINSSFCYNKNSILS